MNSSNISTLATLGSNSTPNAPTPNNYHVPTTNGNGGDRQIAQVAPFSVRLPNGSIPDWTDYLNDTIEHTHGHGSGNNFTDHAYSSLSAADFGVFSSENDSPSARTAGSSPLIRRPTTRLQTQRRSFNM